MSEESGILDQVKRFHLLQEERVSTYKLFDEGFQAYLKGAPHYNFPMYRQLVHEITETFKNISAEIIGIIESLKNQKQNQIAKLMEQIQAEEQIKLELTAKHQLVQQNIIDHHEEESYKEEAAGIKERIKDQIQLINEHLEELKFECEDLYECER